MAIDLATLKDQLKDGVGRLKQCFRNLPELIPDGIELARGGVTSNLDDTCLEYDSSLEPGEHFQFLNRAFSFVFGPLNGIITFPERGWRLGELTELLEVIIEDIFTGSDEFHGDLQKILLWINSLCHASELLHGFPHREQDVIPVEDEKSQHCPHLLYLHYN